MEHQLSSWACPAQLQTDLLVKGGWAEWGRYGTAWHPTSWELGPEERAARKAGEVNGHFPDGRDYHSHHEPAGCLPPFLSDGVG